jgi:hypothetical protein
MRLIFSLGSGGQDLHVSWGRGFALVIGLLLAACGEQETQRTLPSVQLAMDPSVAVSYDDLEEQIYEVRARVPLPILAPTPTEASNLAGESMAPYPHAPWLTIDEMKVQLSYTITNLDDQEHVVEILVDPWNEFASYYPGLMAVDPEEGEYIPNLSGINSRVLLAGKGQGERSRLHGVFTFDDMEEMARDFATVMQMIQNPPEDPGQVEGEEGGGALVALVNHTYANHSTRDVLATPYIPGTIAALTGYDLGLRTGEPATIAIEVVAEVVDLGAEKLETDDHKGELLPEPEEVITVGSAPP